MYERVPFGEESNYCESEEYYCSHCEVSPGEFHEEDCDGEQCPKCGEQLITCECQGEIVSDEMLRAEAEKNKAETGKNRKFDPSLVKRDEGGKFLTQGGPGRKEKPETVILRRIQKALTNGADKAVSALIGHLKDKDKKIQQGAAKIILGKVIPDQFLNQSWQVILKETPQESNLLKALPMFAEYLRWKEKRDLEMDGIDIENFDRQVAKDRDEQDAHTEEKAYE